MERPWKVTAYSGAEKPRAAEYLVTRASVTLYDASAPRRKPSRPRTVSAVNVGPFMEKHFSMGKNRISEEPGEGPHTNLEDVQNCAGVNARLLVCRAEEHRLCVLLREERGGGVELEALGDLVLELDLGAERVVGGPGLSDGQAVGFVGVFALEVAGDVGRFCVTDAVDLEGNVRRGGGFDL